MVCQVDTGVSSDMKVLARFVEIYCRARHTRARKTLVTMKTQNIERVLGRPLRLCPSCRKLVLHAFTKRAHCPMTPKPMCKHCRDHCYHPAYRDAIRDVMKYSGRRLVLTGRLNYLFHLLF